MGHPERYTHRFDGDSKRRLCGIIVRSDPKVTPFIDGMCVHNDNHMVEVVPGAGLSKKGGQRGKYSHVLQLLYRL